MSNKVFNHKLTVLSVSLLALFLGGCGGGSGGVNTGATGGAKAPVVDAGAGKGTDAGAGKGTDAGAGKGTDAGTGADAGAGKGTDAGAGKGTDAGTGTDAGAGKGTDAGTGKGTDAGTGTDAGAGKGTDAGAGKGTDVAPPKPEVKNPELVKVDNPDLPKKDLLGAKKSYTELSGYSFNAGFAKNDNNHTPLLVKETKGLLAEEESEGANGKEKVNFKSSIKTGADGQPFVADTGVEKEVDHVNIERSPDIGSYFLTDIVAGADKSNWKGEDDNSMYVTNFGSVSIGVLRYLTQEGVPSGAGNGVRESVFFYRAKEPDSLMPVDGKITYKGLWLYATKAFDNGKGLLQSGEYRNYIDTYDSTASPTISLTADFAKKEVTGDFKTAPNNGGDNLSLKVKSAPIKGNGFSGVAEVVSAEDSTNPNHYVGVLSKGDEIDLKGTFYGLAKSIGGYLSKNKDGEQVFAGVFAGQEDTNTKVTPSGFEGVKPAENDQPYIDSILKVDQASGKVDLSEPQFTGDIDKLNLGDDVGVALTGIKDTGIDFQFLRLSNFAQDGSSYKFNQASLGQNGDTGYFIQGYLSSSDDVIALGQQYNKVYFAGKWLGWGKAGDKTTSAHYADARYVADFSGSNKELKGWLYKPGSTDVSDDVKADIAKAQKAGTNFEGVNINAVIDGNSFKTTVDKSSVNLDGVKGDVNVQGHFFGTKDNPANELGGTVVGVDGTQFGGVFAGKQVKGQSEKR